jgi:hypothetical protein
MNRRSNTSFVVATGLALAVSWTSTAAAQSVREGSSPASETDETDETQRVDDGSYAPPKRARGRFIVVEETDEENDEYERRPRRNRYGNEEDLGDYEERRSGPSQRTVGIGLGIGGLALGLAGGALAIGGSASGSEPLMITGAVIGLTGTAVGLAGYIVSVTADSASAAPPPFRFAVGPASAAFELDF